MVSFDRRSGALGESNNGYPWMSLQGSAGPGPGNSIGRATGDIDTGDFDSFNFYASTEHSTNTESFDETGEYFMVTSWEKDRLIDVRLPADSVRIIEPCPDGRVMKLEAGISWAFTSGLGDGCAWSSTISQDRFPSAPAWTLFKQNLLSEQQQREIAESRIRQLGVEQLRQSSTVTAHRHAFSGTRQSRDVRRVGLKHPKPGGSGLRWGGGGLCRRRGGLS